MWGSIENLNFWWHRCEMCNRLLSLQIRNPNYVHISMDIETAEDVWHEPGKKRIRSHYTVLESHHCKVKDITPTYKTKVHLDERKKTLEKDRTPK